MKNFDLEAEIRDLAARREITKAVHRYIRGQDRLIPELQRSAFHNGAYVDCGLFDGDGDKYTAMAQEALGQMKRTQHLLGQIDIEVDGDRATGEVYFISWHRIVEDGEDRDWFWAGRYIDEYACIDGEWRIAKRRELVDWIRNDPPSDAFIEQTPGIHIAGHGDRDFSVTRNWPDR